MSHRREHAALVRRAFRGWTVIVVLVLASAPTGGAELVDRIVASVNNDVITLSELRQTVAINALAGRQENGRRMAAETLEGLVNRKLLLQEAYRLRFADVTDQDIAAERRKFQSRFGSDEEYRVFLQSAEISEEQLDRMLGERLLVKRFVQRKIELYVRVNREDVEAYFRDHAAEFGGRRFSEVQQQITDLLAGQQIGQQLDAYTAELRGRADIRKNPLTERDGF
jgi:peptidyl-prolyl cis-trans isomerase SurA